jgi:hypothetical protein
MGRAESYSHAIWRLSGPGPGRALCVTLCAVTGITNRSLHALMTGLLGAPYSMAQASYDLARLRRNGLITRQYLRPDPRRPEVRGLLYQGPRPRPVPAVRLRTPGSTAAACCPDHSSAPHRRPARFRKAAHGRLTDSAHLSESSPQRVATLPAVASYATGFAEPNSPDVHSPGFGTYRG